jgi:hypothetical protein
MPLERNGGRQRGRHDPISGRIAAAQAFSGRHDRNYRRESTRLLEAITQVPIPVPTDVAIASACGHRA